MDHPEIMQQITPTTGSKLTFLEPLTYLWVAILSCWGGIANFCHKLKIGHSRTFNIAELIGELVISSFTGIITYYFCRATDVDEYVTAMLVGISGHMGSRAIFLIERKLLARLGFSKEDIYECKKCKYRQQGNKDSPDEDIT